MNGRRNLLRILGVGLAATAALIASGESLRHPATASAAGTAFTAGDLIVTGHGVRWLRPDGSLVAKLEPDSFATTAAAFRANGGARPLYVVTSPLVTRNYGPDGTYLYYFAFDTLAERTTAVALDPGGVGFLATQHGRLNQIFGFKEDPTKASGTALASFFVVASQINDLETASDGCSLFVATKTLGVFRFDACTFRVLPQLVPNLEVSRIRLLPDATALLILPGQASIRRIDGNGKTIREYAATGVAGGWVAVDLAPDARSFWAATASGALYRLDLATGAVLQGPLQVSDTATDLVVANAPLGTAPPPGPATASPDIDLDGVSTLTGSTLSGIFPVRAAPERNCTTTTSQIDYTDGSGVAIGPYPGRFQAQGTATLGSQSLPRSLGGLGLRPGPVQRLRSSFTISGSVPVEGTVSTTAASSANIGTCATFAHRTFPNSPIFPPNVSLNGYEWTLSGEALAYQATIRKNGRSYVDAGQAFLYATRLYFLDEAGRDSGSGGRIAQYLVSSSIAVNDQFLRPKETLPHSAGIPEKTPQVDVTTRWTNPKDKFSIANLRLVVNGRTVARVGGSGADKLPVRITRTKKSVTAHVSGLRQGRLKFEVKANSVHGRTKATTSVHKRARTKTAV